jgi:hypothetical protein
MEIKYTFSDQVSGDMERAKLMLVADKLLAILKDLDDDLRAKLKYTDLNENEVKAYQSVRKFLHDQITEHQLYDYFM